MSLLYGAMPNPIVTTYGSTVPKPAFYSVGVDLGSVSNSTAITIVEIGKADAIEYQHTKFAPTPQEASRKPELHGIVRLVHRPRLGTNYETIVQQVASIMADLPNMKEPPMLCWDGGGLGGPVVQLARSRGLKRSISIVITGGNNAALVGRDWSVPKALLVGELRLALHQKRLKVAQGFRDRDVLAEELAAFPRRRSVQAGALRSRPLGTRMTTRCCRWRSGGLRLVTGRSRCATSNWTG